MNWRNYVPRSVKRQFRTIRNAGRRWLAPTSKSRAELHQYWQRTNNGENAPEESLQPGHPRRRDYLIEIVRECQPSSILEIGCNAGRNLNDLLQAGYRDLTGVEISTMAVQLLKANYPELARHATVKRSSIEDLAKNIPNQQYDFVFTMEVLEYIHADSEWVFEQMARFAKHRILTIENEGRQSWLQYPRDYRKVFEPFGWTQIREDVSEATIGFGGAYVARLFKRVGT